MSHTLSFRSTKRLADWIEATAAQMGISQGEFIRSHLERVRTGDQSKKKFMRLAGAVREGPRDLSMRKGFSPK